ncbi:MAG: hypothetical protein ACXVII_45380, partial [Solirubrobacteraceae bacterium]
MLGQLDLHRPLDQPLGQLRQHPPGPGDLVLGTSAGEQLVDHLIGQLVDHLLGDPTAVGQLEHPTQPSAIERLIDQLRRELAATGGGERESHRRDAGETLTRLQPRSLELLGVQHDRALRPAWGLGSRRHGDLFRSCLHSSL